MSVALDSPPRLRVSAEDFYRMGEMGLFEGKNVILIDGELIEMPAEGARHFTAIHKAIKSFEAAYPPGPPHFYVRRPGPLQLGLHTDPEPDIAIVRGSPDDFSDRHPTTAELVVEVSETTLRYDRKYKLALYAQARIPEYWIVVLPEKCLEVYREPTDTPAGPGYRPRAIYFPGDKVTPPHSARSIEVGDLF